MRLSWGRSLFAAAPAPLKEICFEWYKCWVGVAEPITTSLDRYLKNPSELPGWVVFWFIEVFESKG